MTARAFTVAVFTAIIGLQILGLVSDYKLPPWSEPGRRFVSIGIIVVVIVWYVIDRIQRPGR